MISERTFRIGNSRPRLLAVLSQLSSMLIRPEDDWELVFRPARKDKTAAQRNYWHQLLEAFGKEVGYSKLEMKQVIKEEVLDWVEVKLPDGTVKKVCPSSEEAERAKYAELIDHTIRRAAECGVLLDDRRVA